MKLRGKIKTRWILLGVFMIIAISVGYYKSDYWNLIPQKSNTSKDFSIEILVSQNDEDKDGIDDYSDILQGARAYVKTKPKYKSDYYEGGYPKEGVGVCTDVVWKAFQNAGFSLKDMIDDDIKNNPSYYSQIKEVDPNIDFRRVQNLKVFFDKHATSLTLDPKKYEQWQPGDIVIYPHHIAIVSDKRNKEGQTYIIHHDHRGQLKYEEDALTRRKIVGHYRYDVKK